MVVVNAVDTTVPERLLVDDTTATHCDSVMREVMTSVLRVTKVPDRNKVVKLETVPRVTGRVVVDMIVVDVEPACGAVVVEISDSVTLKVVGMVLVMVVNPVKIVVDREVDVVGVVTVLVTVPLAVVK